MKSFKSYIAKRNKMNLEIEKLKGLKICFNCDGYTNNGFLFICIKNNGMSTGKMSCCTKFNEKIR
jgi:hypothetical protein